ncbi:MAG TPA: DUF3783 domain-containing protein [Ruminococcaceae bacterium]|nr:DUF3783 domain-containing protein [Oscillospiraceae bacterium]
MSTILIYNLPPEKDAKVKMLCRKLGFASRTVEKSEYGYTLGALLGLSQEDTVKDGEDFDEEMLYIADLRGGMLNLFLDQLRRKKLVVPLKAIQTEMNIGFSSTELYRELCAEREAIAKGTTQHQG